MDEEISLEDALATDMSIIAPVRVCFFIHSFIFHSLWCPPSPQATTPDPGSVQSKSVFNCSHLAFSVLVRITHTGLPSSRSWFLSLVSAAAFLPDLAGQEPEVFVLLTPDLAPRKRSLLSLYYGSSRASVSPPRTGSSFAE